MYLLCILVDTENLGLEFGTGICMLKGLHPLLIVTYKHLTISVSISLLCFSLAAELLISKLDKFVGRKEANLKM